MSELEEKPTAEVLTELPEVATNVYMACKKCECDRYFKVLSHSTAVSCKCQCEVCGAKKTFKLAKKKVPRKTAAQKKIEEQWTALAAANEGINTVAYAVNKSFEENQMIDHPKFGVGFVTKSYPSKIEVLFQADQKLLVHNM